MSSCVLNSIPSIFSSSFFFFYKKTWLFFLRFSFAFETGWRTDKYCGDLMPPPPINLLTLCAHTAIIFADSSPHFSRIYFVGNLFFCYNIFSLLIFTACLIIFIFFSSKDSLPKKSEKLLIFFILLSQILFKHC